MPERSCATCGHNLHNWAKNTCGAGCVGTITHPHWRPRAGVQFVAPKPGGFIEGLYRHGATNRTDIKGPTAAEFEKWATEFLGIGEGNRKESPMVETTWFVEVVQVDSPDTAAGRPNVTYLLAPQFLTGVFTSEQARRRALLLAEAANKGADLTAENVEVHVARPFCGQ